MKFSQMLAMVFVTCASGVVIAGEANPVEMAHQVGFTGCDSLITDMFSGAMRSSERRFSINYFEETSKNSIELLVTYGSPGDTVFQMIHFDKKGEYCYAGGQGTISEIGNCAGLLSKDEFFKYKNDAAGALWAENKGGVAKIFMQSGNACNQVYVRSERIKISK